MRRAEHIQSEQPQIAVITEHFYADEKGSRSSREIRSLSAGTGPDIGLHKA